MELSEFIAARLDEDEAAAKEAASRPLGPAWDDGTRHTAVARHINRHDPARVLREVEAKRKLMARHKVNAEPEIWGDRLDAPEMRGKPTGYTSYWCDECDHDRDYGHIGGREEGCPTVRILAAVWSDHPDYDPAWS